MRLQSLEKKIRVFSALEKQFVEKKSFGMNLYLITFSEVAQIDIQRKKKKETNAKNSKHCGKNRCAVLESVGDHSIGHQLIIF